MTNVAAAPERLAAVIESFLDAAGLARSFEELNIPANQIAEFVEDALRQWTGTFNPVPLNRDRVHSLYRDVSE